MPEKPNTQLYKAANAGDTQAIQSALSQGADINATFKLPPLGDVAPFNLGNALHLAVSSGNIEAVNTLLGAGIDVTVKSTDGETALHRATEELTYQKGNITYRNSAKIIQALIDAGANVDARDNKQQTPLHLAYKHANGRAMKKLLEHGADINAQDKYGKTVLALAAEISPPKTIQWLIKRGANPNIETNHGRTPLDIAKTSPLQEKETVDVLRKYGARSGSGIKRNDVPVADDHEVIPNLSIDELKKRIDAFEQVATNNNADFITTRSERREEKKALARVFEYADYDKKSKGIDNKELRKLWKLLEENPEVAYQLHYINQEITSNTDRSNLYMRDLMTLIYASGTTVRDISSPPPPIPLFNHNRDTHQHNR